VQWALKNDSGACTFNMCGLIGFWQASNFSADAAQAVAVKMADRIAHRGPDDAGVWVDESAGIALAHRRLSILDLSPAGHQPMQSACGRFVLAFNGEIYNLELRLKKQISISKSFHEPVADPVSTRKLSQKSPLQLTSGKCKALYIATKSKFLSTPRESQLF
jgi:glutamine phosphoribosylpyrophosphate amidotransferase